MSTLVILESVSRSLFCERTIQNQMSYCAKLSAGNIVLMIAVGGGNEIRYIYGLTVTYGDTVLITVVFKFVVDSKARFVLQVYDTWCDLKMAYFIP